MRFEVHCLRFVLEARESLFFPPGKAANVLRGAFGWALHHADPASAPSVFSPKLSAGPSGLNDAPRPFVFRASHLDGKQFAPGASFYFGVNLFETGVNLVPRFAVTFAQLAAEGIGPGRARCSTVSMDQTSHSIELNDENPGVSSVLVRFVTPTELKGHDGTLLREPEFGVLLARIRDRISTLRQLYGGGPLDLDFRAFGERASKVRTVRSDLRNVQVERISSRTGQRHSIGGFVGEVEYEGDAGEFLPYLRTASFTGAGRQTVWGKGEIALHSEGS
ncbi:MAG: CRISPR system precrRNA processing endoribonuclease RAMP protein Cas6 [Candidatus Solibacter usitatus]|nr:CRISPR system precrRNA processing endoribonuclease RAMP protein Cas6 [Candidatus Solibacter usitatus]